MAEWNVELANELKTVLKGGNYETTPSIIQGIIDELESGTVNEQLIANRLRQAKLGWFAQRLESNTFHERG